MPIYNKPVRGLIPEMAAELAPQPGQMFSKDAAIEWFTQRYPKIKQGTISAHLIRFSTNAPSRLHYNARPDEDLLYQVDGGHFRLYDPSKDPAPIHSKSDVGIAPRPPAEPGESEAPSEFAYESDLRDFLAKNLSVIEAGLQLYQEEGITGVEFPVGGRFVDILAVDAEKQLVVIELRYREATTGWSANSSDTWLGFRSIMPNLDKQYEALLLRVRFRTISSSPVPICLLCPSMSTSCP